MTYIVGYYTSTPSASSTPIATTTANSNGDFHFDTPLPMGGYIGISPNSYPSGQAPSYSFSPVQITPTNYDDAILYGKAITYSVTIKVEDSVGNLITNKEWYVNTGSTPSGTLGTSIYRTGTATFTGVKIGTVFMLVDKYGKSVTSTVLTVPSSSYVFKITNIYSTFAVNLTYYNGTNSVPSTFPYSATVTVGSQSQTNSSGSFLFKDVTIGEIVSVSTSSGYAFPSATVSSQNAGSSGTGSMTITANKYPISGNISGVSS